LAHRVGTRDIVWQLATLSVQLYFPCTPSSQGVVVSTAATNSLGLSQSPFPLFPLRSSSVFSLSLDCLGSRQPGWTQGEGLGSLNYFMSALLEPRPLLTERHRSETPVLGNSYTVLSLMNRYSHRW
jgi:hypothetical protein